MDKPADIPKGKHFERRVANLFALLGYSVKLDVLIGGRQVDLYLEDRSGPISHVFIVECKNQATPVTTAQYDSFRGRVFAAKSEINPKVRGIIVSSVGFVKEARAQSQHDEIELIAITELETSVIDFRQYVRSLIGNLEGDPTLSHFVEPHLRREYLTRSQSAYSLINEWLADPLSNQMTLLGDYGTGKSTLLKHLALTMARKYEQEVLEEGARGRVPLFVDLRDYTHAISLKQIILDLLDANAIKAASYAAFEHISSEGQLLLILDGFDEMASRGNYKITLRNFRELNKSAKGRAKIILSCRTHYFTTDRDVLRFHGEPTSNRSLPSYTDLYREIATRPNFVITYLLEFQPQQVEQYLRNRCGTRWKEVQSFIEATYNLTELSRKPVLLEMIVSSEGRIEIGNRTVTPGVLYQVYTDIWLARNDWSLTIDVATKSELLERFALSASLNPESQLDYRDIPKLIKSWKHDIDELDAVEMDRELRTATFLVRDEGGNYKFSHKSFQEFFLAKHLLSEARRDQPDTWAEGFFRTEVYRFIRDLLPSMPDAIEILTRWLQDRLVSEYARANAAKCLGGVLDPQVVEAFLDVLEHTESRIVRRSAATSLGNYSQVNVVSALIRAASNDECRFVRSNCLVALGKMNRPESNAFLLGVINDRNPMVPAGKWERWPLYIAAKGFRDVELVKAAIREGPVKSSGRKSNRLKAIEACLDLCKHYRSPESEQYCIKVLETTTKQRLAALAFSILPNDKRQAFVPKMLTIADKTKLGHISENFIGAFRGTVHQDIEAFLCSLLISGSVRKASVAFEVLAADYPAMVLRNAEHWMGAPHYSAGVRILAATEFAKNSAPNDLDALSVLLAKVAKRSVLDLIYSYYPLHVSKIIQDAWNGESAVFKSASFKRHSLEILLAVDRDAALTLMLNRGLHDPKTGIRVAVCAILAAERSNLVTDALLKALRSDNSKWVRLQALQSICSPGRDVSTRKILEALEGETDPDVKTISGELLGFRA